MIDTDKYEGHTEGPWRVVAKANDYRTTDVVVGKTIVATNISGNDSSLIADAPDLLAEVKRLREEVEFSHLKDWAIMQAEHMRAEVGDNTWHYAMEVWLYPETHYWEYDEEGTVQLIERYITTNRDAWIKHWGEPSKVARKRWEEE